MPLDLTPAALRIAQDQINRLRIAQDQINRLRYALSQSQVVEEDNADSLERANQRVESLAYELQGAKEEQARCRNLAVILAQRTDKSKAALRQAEDELDKIKYGMR